MFFIFNKNTFKKIIPKNLLARFILIIIIPILIGQLISVYLFYQRHWYNVSERTSNFLVKEILFLLENTDYKRNPGNKFNYINLSYKYLPDTKLPFFEKKNIEEIDIFNNLIKKRIYYPISITIKPDNDIKLYIQIQNDLLQITLPSKSLINPTTYIFVLWVLFLTILLLSISLIFSKNQIKSILELTYAAESYGQGREIKNYTPSGAKEIRQAGLAFLKMRDRIERQIAKRTQMLAMISHDLRTPLTRMKLQSEMMEESEEKEELLYDISTMQTIIESYLDFAKGEGGEKLTRYELNSWIKEYVDNQWSKENIDLNIYKKNLVVNIKPNSFKRALSNIISNAIKYSTKIKISVYSKRDNIIITIEDDGPGIDDSEKNIVFKPFYRIDKSRSLDNTSSVGLGLAITKEIIIGHYGLITLEDSVELKGLLVRIILPKYLGDE